ncbi:MAG: C39 family peptidase, partial [Leptospirales bacterium]|nr:C39 family peptidase [Leptospirales bacterium]
KAVWAEVPFRRLRDILYTSPAIFGTMLTGTGHIILLKGYDNDGFYVNDPWGIATTGYKDHNGDTWYSNDLVKKTGETRTARSDIMRVMYA